jgi:putative aldouronate transport system permease protein
MSVPFVLWLVVFKYIPIWGWLMAFQDYKPYLGFFQQKWIGISHFRELFRSPLFYQSMQNTLGMSILGLIFGTVSALAFAIILNELRFLSAKRITQTISYLPHFISWVVAANIVTSVMSINGPINDVLMTLKIIKEPVNVMLKSEYFWWVVVFSDMWKETGWNAIIYLAAMTGIDSQVYEAAEIDGANRIQRIWFITLPGISFTIFILLILSIGNLINIGFEKQILLSNAITAPKALVLDKYALDYGIGLFRYSFGTAIGIFKSVVSIILLLLANYLIKKSGKGKLF